jgi:hypothetical protein
MKVKFVLFLCLGIAVALISCKSGSKKVAGLAPNAHQVVAEEVLQTSSYTYVRVSEDGKEYWMAIDYADIKKGGTYFWLQGGEMKDFKSKELNRTFPTIFFVADFTDKPITSNAPKQGTAGPGRQRTAEKPGIVVQKAEGGVTIAELYAKRTSFDGKSVKIRGEVIKFSKDIMKKNWVHLQDGTKDGNNYDLTITTRDTVRAGEVVMFEGVIRLNKDFGYEYTYELIMEDAALRIKM